MKGCVKEIDTKWILDIVNQGLWFRPKFVDFDSYIFKIFSSVVGKSSHRIF